MSCEFCVFLRYRLAVRWTPEAIRQAREARDWTQPELAEALGVSPRSISSWEAGTAKPRNYTQLDSVLGTGDVAGGADDPRLSEATPTELIAALLKKISSLERVIAQGVVTGGHVGSTGVHIRYLRELPPEVLAQQDDEIIGERSDPDTERRSVPRTGE